MATTTKTVRGSALGCTPMRGSLSGVRARVNPQRRAQVQARATKPGGGQNQAEGGNPLCAKLTSAGLAALVATSPVCGAAIASEFDVLEAPVPSASYIVDDGGILSKAGRGAIKGKLQELEKTTGYHLDVVTMRKLQFTPDPFEFSDKVLENWYPTLEQGNNKGVLLIIAATKEGGISGGPKFLDAVGNDVLDGIISETIPNLAAEEKFNEATLKSVQRITAVLQGKGDPFAPKAAKAARSGPKKSKEEVQGTFTTIFRALAVIIIGTPLAQTALTAALKAREEE
ncbi:TPM_phosphatase domain-containing protein [Chloropicon roscoffensis]|uniref:TPM_phosphatase domain-containing protein n=1 Tax=Chloropicon roscoffensis TaxID=1461544 RepID=A0A7S3C658_9CHLO|mmetsp:Transcript_10233/g.31270  ORF Transcript_10233/g.31270 Transcript_10233/m.31270 type:complete len:285 (+) Transcript_10233:91-945(+)